MTPEKTFATWQIANIVSGADRHAYSAERLSDIARKAGHDTWEEAVAHMQSVLWLSRVPARSCIGCEAERNGAGHLGGHTCEDPPSALD